MHDAQSLHMNLLQALLCAGMHSRAAYGYAMAAGHLSSLLNFALLQTVRTPVLCLLSQQLTSPIGGIFTPLGKSFRPIAC